MSTVSMIRRLTALLLFSLLVSCGPRHPLGEGAATPKEALEKLLVSIETLDFAAMRKVVFWDKFCADMDIIAVNVDDAKVIERYLQEHPDTRKYLAKKAASNESHDLIEAFRQNWYTISSQFRTNFMRYFPELKGMEPIDHDGDGIIRLTYKSLDSQPGEAQINRELILKRIDGRWYVYTLTCHAM